MRHLVACFLAAIAAAAVDAQQVEAPAEIRGFYLGAGLGRSEPASYDGDYWYSDTESGDGDTATSAFVGYRFHRFVAVEAAYLDSGTPGWDEQLVYVPQLQDYYNTDIDFDVTSSQLSVLGILPLARIWEVYLRGGLAFWEADGARRFIPSFGGPAVGDAVDESGTGLLLGVGGGVTLLPGLHLRLEFQFFDVDDDIYAIDDDSASIDTILVDLQYRFGAR